MVSFLFPSILQNLNKDILTGFKTFLLVFDMRQYHLNLRSCNSFCFWYNEDTKRAEQQLDSDVDR